MHHAFAPYSLCMAVELRHLRALLAVVEEGTFTDAAIALRTSQASVSRAVADLEGSLGIRLLQRTNRGALPTVPGRRVVDHARQILVEIAAIERLRDSTGSELRVGFAWAGLGRHTTAVQRRWRADHPASTLTFVQSISPTSGLLEGEADIAVLRRPLDDHRFETSLIGVDTRYAAMAADDPLAGRRSLTLADLTGRTVAIDHTTGTTSTALWPPDAAPATRDVHGIEEWLTLIAAGIAVGVTSRATTEQFRRPDVRYRPLRDAPPIPVWLAWWKDDPPPGALLLRQLVCELLRQGS
jgi:DNA-binding transcriptional LysR family regulator